MSRPLQLEPVSSSDNWNESDTSPIYQAFDAAGLIGCISTGEELSTTYKDKMDFSNKVGGAT